MNKTLIIVIVCVVAGLAAAVGGAIWWWKTNSEEIFVSLDSAMKEGTAQGATNDEQGCLDLAFRRHADLANQGIWAAARNGMVLTTCLTDAKPTKDFCNGVPSENHLLDVAAWAQETCTKQGFKDTACPSLMQQVTYYCSSPQFLDKHKISPADPKGGMITMAPVGSLLLARVSRRPSRA